MSVFNRLNTALETDRRFTTFLYGALCLFWLLAGIGETRIWALASRAAVVGIFGWLAYRDLRLWKTEGRFKQADPAEPSG